MESINGLILSYLEVTFGNAIKYVVLWRYHFKTHRQVHELVNNIQGVFLILWGKKVAEKKICGN